jgi:hypothetical protein
MFCYPNENSGSAYGAMAGKITWFQAAEILGFADRHLRRIRERSQEFGDDGLFDRRLGKPSAKRVPPNADLVRASRPLDRPRSGCAGASVCHRQQTGLAVNPQHQTLHEGRRSSDICPRRSSWLCQPLFR